MAAPLCGLLRVNLILCGFPSVPGLLNKIPCDTLFPISRESTSLEGCDCGCLSTYFYLLSIFCVASDLGLNAMEELHVKVG
jgi:hypothetical protein